MKRDLSKSNLDDPELIAALKKAEAKFNINKVQRAQHEIENAYSHKFTQDEVEEIASLPNIDSSRTTGLLMCMILMLVLDLFWVLCTVMISLIVFFADDEVEMLHEMENFDSKVFRLHLGEPIVLM